MNENLLNDLGQILLELKPKNALIMAKEEIDFKIDITPIQIDYLIAPQSYEDIKAGQQYELCIMLPIIDQLSTRHTEQIIGRIRSLHSKRILLATQHLERSHEFFYAFGMSCLNEYSDQHSVTRLYEYNIHSYKSVPDWLNNRFWANPEMWNKYRW